MILKMQDGGIEVLNLSSREMGGRCSTCDFDKVLITNLEIRLTKYTICAEFRDEYNNNVGYLSESDLMLILLRNVEDIMQNSESHFCQWFKNKVNGKCVRFVMNAKKYMKGTK